MAVGVVRAARTVHRLLKRHALRPGPRESVIVGGAEVLLAAAGMRRPRVLVSAGALIALDDAELSAGLDHERGHIARRHRYLLVLAQLLYALGRLVPGSRQALRELSFHLERDADRWSLARRNDRQALARVITKAATSRPLAASTTLASLAGHGAVERVRQLLDDRVVLERRRATLLHVVGLAMVTVTVALGGMLPAAVAASVDRLPDDAGIRHCVE